MTLKELIEQYSYKNEGVYTFIDIEELCKEYAELFRIKILEEVQCNEDSWRMVKESISDVELP